MSYAIRERPERGEERRGEKKSIGAKFGVPRWECSSLTLIHCSLLFDPRRCRVWAAGERLVGPAGADGTRHPSRALYVATQEGLAA